MSDHEIRSAAADGSLDADALAAHCNAGTRCGGCIPVVEAILDEVAVTICSAA